MRRKILALLLAAALAISLLAGCGGGKALSQVIVDLLGGLYSNVSVEADSDLTAALKQAAAEGGTEEEILSRMIEILNHNGVSITFTRLGSGQQGDHAVTLYFQTGTDPDAAARNALAQWAGTLGTLPDDGSYQADVAMIETENGYYIALDVEVLKAGKPDKPDKDDDEPETQEPPEQEKGYTETKDENGNVTYTVEAENGLQELFNDKKNDINKDTVIKLTADKEYTVTEQLTDNFAGKLTSEGGKAKITLSGTSGLFGTIAGGAEVSNLDITVSNTINGGGNVGAVAGENNGTIQNCHVTGGTIQGTGGENSYVGGIVGANGAVSTSGSIIGCSAEVTVKNGTYAGGVVGKNYSGSITACFSTGAVTSDDYAGGVVGVNHGTVTACYHAGGEVRGVIFACGGVAGSAYSNTVNTCYWSGQVDSGNGIGNGNGGETTRVDGTDVTWQMAVNAMNTAIAKWNTDNSDKQCNYQYKDGNPPKIIPGAPTSTTTP